MQKINIYNTSINPNFTGIKLETSKNFVKNIETKIDLYEITKKDDNFLEKLRNKIKMKELMPDSNITEDEFERWQEIFNLAIRRANTSNRTSILAVKDDKPCGILTYQSNGKTFNIESVCTWPVNKGEKVTLAGKSLFKTLFSKFLSNDSEIIKLNAILNGPFSAVSKYMQLGFKQTGGEDYLVAMRTNKEGVKQALEKLNKIIFTEKNKSSKEVDLLKKCNLQ